MIAGLSGSMLSHDALAAHGYARPLDEPATAVRQQVRRWHHLVARTSGPAWSARNVYDGIAAPFCHSLGFEVLPTTAGKGCVHGRLSVHARTVAALVATPWGHDAAAVWREGVRTGIAEGVRWCFCFNGPALRIFDATRTHSRRHTEFDLDRVATDPDTFAVAWRLLHVSGFGATDEADALTRAVARSERHRGQVRESLQQGVQQALVSLTTAFVSARRARRRVPLATHQAFDESLVVVYRVLFLLFAEARGLVPTWHPLFRESYTIEALRAAVETRGRTTGVWAALQAIARLAHKGCHAGPLRVPPFNGRLFSPAHAPLAESLPLDEALVRDALAALTTRPGEGGLERIAYGDLGVEHLGGVYERVLDFDVATIDDRAHLVRGEKRKATGSFYTPRALTEHLVRRTLAPLVAGATPEEILRLRVLDPAMGSGAFLVAACRYLAHAYELALVREGTLTHADITDRERAAFRRSVAQRCLYGVDLNPMAVQLARLSLWLATLSGDRPLTFFDHHLRAGNSLVGASLDDVRRGSATVARVGPLPLFDAGAMDRDLEAAVASHSRLRDDPEDTLAQVRAKESLFAHLASPEGPLGRWKRVADLWCAGWFDPAVGRLRGGVFRDLLDGGALPDAVSRPLLESARAAADRERFFHWTLEFPDVFAHGAGFDAIVGNPPWDVLRTTGGGALTRFSRASGCYRAQSRGHANLYQLFTERSLSLLRPGGRLGLVLPSGFAIDHGCSGLRRYVLDASSVDSFTVVHNREALFPIHRGLKFALLTATSGDRTSVVPCRFGVQAAAEFDRLPELGRDPAAVEVTRDLMERLSGEQLAIPELTTAVDAAIAGRMALAHRAAGDAAGWGLRFGRELNATDDKALFQDRTPARLPVVEGKQLRPFHVDVDSSAQGIDPRTAQKALPSRPFARARLAYRDVAAATNRLTLIAALLPAGVVSTHTLFCLKSCLDEDAQLYLCGLFNSFVANYLVRLRVSTHVTVAIVERLPLPMADRDGNQFADMVSIARRLTDDPGDAETSARHQALAARLYGLNTEEFAHVLATFPLVDRGERDRAFAVFVDRL